MNVNLQQFATKCQDLGATMANHYGYAPKSSKRVTLQDLVPGDVVLYVHAARHRGRVTTSTHQFTITKIVPQSNGQLKILGDKANWFYGKPEDAINVVIQP